jgi:hypothetical protein
VTAFTAAEHELVQDEALDLLLAGVEPTDRDQYDKHLAQCPDCTQFVSDVARMGEALAAAPALETPPPQLRDRLLAAALQEPGVAQPGAAAAADAPSGDEAQPPATLRSRRVDELSARRDAAARRRNRVVSRVGAAAAVILLAASIGWGLTQRSAHDDAADRAQRLSQVVNSLSSPGPVQVASIAGKNGVVATAFVRPDGALVLPANLPANNTDNSMYVLWSLVSPTDSAPVPIGSFDVTSSALTSAVMMTGRAPSGNWFAISAEPGRTVPSAPTTVLGAGQA